MTTTITQVADTLSAAATQLRSIDLTPPPDVAGLKPVIVRCTGAGVHFGYLVSQTDTTIVLRRSRRLWKWAGAFTLSEVASIGPAVNGSRFGAPVEITLAGWHEIISCTPEAVTKIAQVGS